MAFLRLRAPEVQAVLTVLGRGRFADPDPEAPQLDLADTDLRRASLWGADLPGRTPGRHRRPRPVSRRMLLQATLNGGRELGAG